MTTPGVAAPSWLLLPWREARAWWTSFARTDATTVNRITTLMTLTIVGLAIWPIAFGLVFSRLSEHHAQQNLYTEFRQQLAEATAPIGGPIADGAPVALLNAAAGGLHGLIVVEGTTSTDLKSGPGHYPGSPLPGQPGASTVFGRGTTYGAPFAPSGGSESAT